MSSANVNIYDENSSPLGYSFGEWSIKWWQWLLSIPKSNNPLLDMSGENAAIGQSDSDVFFLCQTVENVNQRPTRNISVSKGTSLFSPVINWVSNFYEDGHSEKELIETARRKMDIIGDLQFYLNGESIPALKKYRFLSKFFSVDIPRDNIFDWPSGEARLVSDGYWVFTKPLLMDTIISTFGTCSSGLTKIGVKYNIKVV
jgi:hypothetical protein